MSATNMCCTSPSLTTRILKSGFLCLSISSRLIARQRAIASTSRNGTYFDGAYLKSAMCSCLLNLPRDVDVDACRAKLADDGLVRLRVRDQAGELGDDAERRERAPAELG